MQVVAYRLLPIPNRHQAKMKPAFCHPWRPQTRACSWLRQLRSKALCPQDVRVGRLPSFSDRQGKVLDYIGLRPSYMLSPCSWSLPVRAYKGGIGDNEAATSLLKLLLLCSATAALSVRNTTLLATGIPGPHNTNSHEHLKLASKRRQ